MLVCSNLQRNGTGNGLSNIKHTFAESFQLQISVLHQSMCIFKSGLSSLSDGSEKYKEKVPDMSDSNQNLEKTCNSKLKFPELKYFFIKRVLNYVLYVTNTTAILEHPVFSER